MAAEMINEMANEPLPDNYVEAASVNDISDEYTIISIPETFDIYPEKNRKNLATVDWTITSPRARQVASETAAFIDSNSMTDVNNEVLAMDEENSQIGVENALTQVALETPEAVAPALAEAQTALETQRRLRESPLGPSVAWVNSLENADKIPENIRMKVAANHHFSVKMAELFDDASAWDLGADFLGLMFYPDEGWNASNLNQAMGADVDKVSSYMFSHEGLMRLAQFRNELPPEAIPYWDEMLTENMQDETGNFMKTYITLSQAVGLDPNADVDHLLEKAGIFATVNGLGRRVVRGLMTFNRMRMLSKTNQNADTVAMLADLAARKPDAGRALGIPQADAAQAFNPIKVGVLQGAPEEMSAIYRSHMRAVDEGLDYAFDTMKIDFRVTPEEAEKLAASVERRMGKMPNVEDVEVVKAVEGLHIKYLIKDDNGARIAEDYVPYTLDAIGGFQQKEAGLLNSLNFTASPNIRVGKDRDILVQQAEAIVATTAKRQMGYAQAMEAAIAPIKGNKKSVNNVSSMLEALDEQQIVPSYQKLVNEGVGGLRLNDAEFLAFKGIRRILDDAYETSNTALRREMEIKGLSEVKMGDKAVFAKAYQTPEAARMGFLQSEEHMVFVEGRGIQSFDKAEALDEFLGKGYRLVKADSREHLDWFKDGNDFVRFALVKADKVGELPQRVLKQVPNYLPKIRENATTYVQKMVTRNIDGKRKTVAETVAWAETGSQAARYVERANKALVDAGKEAAEYKIIHADDPILSGRAVEDNMRIAGGMYRADRKATELEFAGEIGGGKRVEALDAIQQYMGYMSRRMPMSEWRMNVQQRWINDMADRLPNIRNMRWHEMREAVKGSNLDQQVKAKYLTSFDQIQGMLGVPTKEEQAFQGFLRSVAKVFDKPGAGKRREEVAKFLYSPPHALTNPYDAMKGASFHLNLGTFSIVQMPVQAMGMAVALAANPVYAAKGAVNFMLFGMMDNMGKWATSPSFLKKAEKMGVKPGVLKREYEFWRRSGMYDSVVAGNADYAAMANSLPIDRNVISRLADKGTMFFKAGELANMRVSFATALEREKAINKAFNYTDDDLRKVLARAEQYRMNMGAGNKAWFQRGIVSLPTQFKQIYTKFAETMLGDWFTPQERMRIATAQMALFGSLGIPMGEHAADWILDQLFEPGELSSEQLMSFKRGIMGWLVSGQMDIDAVVSGRLTLAADWSEEFVKMFDGETSVVEALLGVSFNLFGRGAETGKAIYRNFKSMEEWTPENMGDALADIGKSMIEWSASGRKALQAYDLYHADAIMRNGEVLVQYDEGEVNNLTILARAIGFSSQDMEDAWKISRAERTLKEKERKLADQITTMTFNWSLAVDHSDANAARRHQNAINFLYSQVDDMEARKRIRQAVVQRLRGREFGDRVMKTWVENRINSNFEDAAKFSIYATSQMEKIKEQ